MKIDKLKQFVVLRQSLLTEKAQLETRLAQINKALGEEVVSTRTATSSPAPSRTSAPRQVNNPMSLKEAVRKVTSARPLTKKEILQAIDKLGYKFTAKDPTNSLNVVLYTKGQFKNDAGKFSPAK